MILNGDCIEEMAKLPDNSIDTLVTDPPAGINFMGKDWDHKAGYQPVDDRDYEVFEAVSKLLQPWEAGFLAFTARWSREALRTPTGGVVLDPFMGSGTTGMACVLEGREFIGIEADPDYFEIATRRIASVQPEPPQKITLSHF
jgi:DNA modification methylase